MDNFETISEKIKIYLISENAIDVDSAIKPQKISKHIFDKPQKKYVNPYLYKMKDNGKINVQKKNGADPHWYLVS